MNPPPRSPAAGGCLTAIAVMLGVIVGLIFGQPTIGFLAGLAIGVVAAVMVWWVDRR
ncbi:MAG TPA: hypothetical protein VFT56_06010 [Sphingomonas sp.]|nr:hypothetical protein [Sphingomonas sp.]